MIGAVACYFAITTITSVISYIAMAILGISGNYLAVADGTVLNLGEYLWKLILFSLVWVPDPQRHPLCGHHLGDEPEAEPALGSRLPVRD